MPRDRPRGVTEHVSRGVPLREHVLLRAAFNRVQAHIRCVANNIRAVGTLHPKHNQEGSKTQSGGSEDEEIDSYDKPIDSDA